MSTSLSGTWRSRLGAVLVASMLGAMALVGISSSPAIASSQGQAIVDAAASQSGKPYCFAGGNTSGPTHGSGGSGCTDPNTVGFDCSGLALYAVFQATGITLPHGHGMESATGGVLVANKTDLLPGDLVFFGGGSLANFVHVGVYAGNGMMWDANDYNTPVQQHSLAWEESALAFDGGVRYWQSSPTPTNRVTGGGALSTRGDQRLDLFIQGTNVSGANTYHDWTDAGPWTGWHLLEASAPTRVSSAVASVSWSPTRIDLMARGVSGDLLHKWWNADTGWGDWVSNGGCIIGAPTVTSWGPGRLDVFAQGCNTTGPNLVHNWWDGSSWHWETVLETGGTRIDSAPSATAWSSSRLDLFAKSTSGTLLHKWYDIGTGWGNWVSNGGCITGAPAVSSWAAGRLDVFAPGCYSSGNNLAHNWWNGSAWAWELTPSGDGLFVTNVLGAVSWGPGRIDIAGRSSSGEPVHKWYDGTYWYNWEHLGGAVAP